MKKLFTLLGVLAAPLGLWADSKIQMVTYFPVPYVAYSKVNATDQLDIGLTTSCIMNLGCTESGNAGLRPLNVTNGVVQKGKLELNTAAAVSGSTVSIGSGSGSGSMNFNSNLRVNTLNDGVSVEANNMTVDTLKLFPNRITTDFPSCASTGAPGTPNISWQKLKLKDKEEVYLMCGEAKKAEDCSDASYKQAHKSECCPSVSTSDNICYKDCYEDDYFEWQSAGLNNYYWLGGSGWEKKACSSTASTGSYGECNGTINLALTEEYPCWKGWELAERQGVDYIAYSQTSSTHYSLCDAAGGSCVGSWDVGATCLVFQRSSRYYCRWNGISPTPVEASFNGVFQVWQCQQQKGDSYRCKNGW